MIDVPAEVATKTDSGSMVAVWTLVVVQVFTFLTMWLKRRWEIQDRDALAKKVKDEAEMLAKKVDESAMAAAKSRTSLKNELSEQSHNHKVALALQIEETKEIGLKTQEVAIDTRDKASAAYEVGNHISEKIASIGLEHNRLDAEKLKGKE
jgi:biopolymer transport protein ExbB/TolQ